MKLTTESTVVNDKKINTDIDNAQTTADDAKTIATDTAQYFWFASSGTDAGAHISEQTRADFEANPSGGNLLANSNGIAVRDGLTELATFGATARIGKESTNNILINSDGLAFREGTASRIGFSSSIGSDLINAKISAGSDITEGYILFQNSTSTDASTVDIFSAGIDSVQPTTRLQMVHDPNTAYLRLSATRVAPTKAVQLELWADSNSQYISLKAPQVKMQLDTSDALYTAINDLGWTDVIV